VQHAIKAAVTPIIVLFTIYQTCAQSINRQDTIAFARTLAYQKQFNEADQLLTGYNEHHSDVNALQLHAQVLYWMKQFDRSAAVYENTINRFPNAIALQLDYGRMQFELYHLNKAKSILMKVIAHDSTQTEAGTILKQIKTYTAPWVMLNMNLESDDQPRTGNSYGFEAGMYRSSLWSPVIQAQLNRFIISDSNYNSLWLQAGNKINVGNKTTISFGAGVFQHLLNTGCSYFTGRLGITQKMGASFSAEAGFEKKPYQYSIASVTKPVLEQDVTLAVNFNKNDNWLGKIGYQQQHFNDSNNIHTVYAWLLFPVIKSKTFNLKAGYAFSYANADKNNYVSSKPLSAIPPSAVANSTLSGVYDPYFTQQNQLINAVLASIGISFSKSIQFSTRASVGIYAKANNPSLTYEKDRSNQAYISKTYSTITYTPVEWVNSMQVKLSPAFSIQAFYNYSKLLFYTRNQGGIQLKYNFINGSNQ